MECAHGFTLFEFFNCINLTDQYDSITCIITGPWQIFIVSMTPRQYCGVPYVKERGLSAHSL